MTMHSDALALTGERVQRLGLKLPNPALDHVTSPIGGTLPDGATSLTSTVHMTGWPTTTGLGTQNLSIRVGSTGVAWITSAPLVLTETAGPNASSSRTP